MKRRQSEIRTPMERAFVAFNNNYGAEETENWVLRVGPDSYNSINKDGVYCLGAHKFCASGHDAWYESIRRAKLYILRTGITTNIRFYCVSPRGALCFCAFNMRPPSKEEENKND